VTPRTRQTPAGEGRGSSEIIRDDELEGHDTGADLLSRISTAARVATGWLAGEPVADELESFVLLLDRCERDLARVTT
jgi:hypothetical protein